MLVHSRVASCQVSPGDVVFVVNYARLCALNSCGLLLVNPSQSFSQTCWLRCGSSRSRRITTSQVETRAGLKRTKELRSCKSSITVFEVGGLDLDGGKCIPAFEVDTAVHDFVLLSTDDEAVAQDGEWESFGRDGRLERLSICSRCGFVVSNNMGTIAFGTELETLESAGWPIDDGMGRNVEGLNLNGTLLHPKVSATDGKEVLSALSAQNGSNKENSTEQRIKKRGSLDIRKPFQGTPAKTGQEPRISGAIVAEMLEQPELKDDLEYYIPKVGDNVTGVVVSANEYQLDIHIGAKHLGRMLFKDLKPFDSFWPDEYFWELDESGESMPAISLGQVRFLGDREALKSTHLLVPSGTVLSLQVYGVTLNGRALLSVRRIASRIAWQRVRQVHEQEEPIEAQCVAWNSDGLIFKIEGLRAFLPLNQLLNRMTVSKSLEDHVGHWKKIIITDVNEVTGKLIVSEKRAWAWRNLQRGSLVVGTVQRILPFGVEILLAGTSLRAMLHISNISHCYIPDIKSVFSMGEMVKALVMNSGNPLNIGLSTANLESSKGLMLQDKKRVFQEAEDMAMRQRCNLCSDDSIEFEKSVDIDSMVEESCPANQDWLDFGEEEIHMLDSSNNEQEQ